MKVAGRKAPMGRRRKRGLTKSQRNARKRGIRVDDDTMSIAKRLSDLLAEKRMAPLTLARASGVPPATVYRYLDPDRYGVRTINLRIVRMLCTCLGVTMYDLITA